jgi:nucleoside 2-deoxyribosyltransferase
LSLTYLASPYTHSDPAVVEARFEAACKAAANMMRFGFKVFSPIAHSHPVEQLGMAEKMSGEFWLRQDFGILRHCDAIAVLTIPGWTKSKGVNAEIELATLLDIPLYVTPDGSTVIRIWSMEQLNEIAQGDE